MHNLDCFFRVTKTAAERRYSIPNDHGTAPLASVDGHGAVLPDRAEFRGRASALDHSTNAQQSSSVSDTLLRDALVRLSSVEAVRPERAAQVGSSTTRVQHWLADNKKHVNPLDTSCLSPDSGTQNDVFGSYIDDDDDDLVYSRK